ncbi:hypothetical protein E1162_06220 [Rhodobacteraceae bacterium RKSG542]|uniref:hypothetical protein n=1 Tax=Pseudovibrio flavus TaxID=2529854 RepID=UPI0012BBF912|nr:hypothetical protein [Pseudovibrio flavus]MTI16829.1 hypothetical protein [Pseudovibrio flavus]
MNNLTLTSTTTQTMSSLDFLNFIINPAREMAGESFVENRKFIARIEDELDDLGVAENFSVTTAQGALRYIKGYNLKEENERRIPVQRQVNAHLRG